MSWRTYSPETPWISSVLVEVVGSKNLLTVRTLCSLRLQNARSIASKDDIVRTFRGDRGIGVVISIQNILEGALHNATLSTQVVDHSLTATDQARLTRLEGVSAVCKAGVRVTGKERGALSPLLCDVVARVSRCWGSPEKRGRKGNERRCEVNHLDVQLWISC